MTLRSMHSLLKDAQKKKKAIGAFNVANLEMITGVIAAAEEENTPVILQFTEAWESYLPIALIGPAMIAAAKNTKIDVVVHYDHGRSMAGIRNAIETGFSSVMFDGSELPIEENIAMMKAVKSIATRKGVSVEGELGVVGGNEEGGEAKEIQCTNPCEARYFSDNSGVDALAIAIGNAHGIYHSIPTLQFDILEECAKNVHTPLVLHGGSGLSAEDFQKAIRYGITKINIATANFNVVTKTIKDTGFESGKDGYFKLQTALTEAVKENVKSYLRIFNMRTL